MPSCRNCKHRIGDRCEYPVDHQNPLRKCNEAIFDLRCAGLTGRVLEIGQGTVKQIRKKLGSMPDVTWEGEDPRKNAGAAAHELPYDDETFDHIMASQSMEHWGELGTELSAGIKEVHRVLKQHGTFIFSVPMLYHGAEIFALGDTTAIVRLFDDGWAIQHLEEWRREHDPLPAFWDRVGVWEEKPLAGYEACGQTEPSSWVLDMVVRKN